MPALEPGEKFDVEYRETQRASVVALSLREQRKLAELVRPMIAAEASGDPMECIRLFDLADAAIRIAIPDVTEEFIDSIDAQDAIEISTKCLGKQAISEDESKKSE